MTSVITQPQKAQWLRAPSFWVAVAATLALLTQFPISPGSNAISAGGLDPPLIHWTLEWGYHALFQELSPRAFWHANSFYPHTLTSTYSDSLLGMQIFYGPFRLMGVESVPAMYLSFCLLTLVAACLSGLALRRIDILGPWEQALIVFSGHFSLPMTTFMFHHQLFGFQLAVPVLLFLFAYVRSFRAFDLFMATVLYAWSVTIAVYAAPIVMALVLVVVLPLAISQVRALGPEEILRRIGLRGTLAAVIPMLGLYVCFIRFYLVAGQSLAKPDVQTLVPYSATLLSLFRDRSGLSRWYDPGSYGVYGAWEYSFFPGIVLLLCAFAYLTFRLFSSRESPDGIWSRSDGDHKHFIRFCMLLFIAALVLSLGPLAKGEGAAMKLPYSYLAALVPGLDRMRAPGRFGIFLGLALGGLAVGLIRATVATPLRREAAAALLLTAIAIDSWPRFGTVPFSVDPEGRYARVAGLVTPGQPLLELPICGKDHMETVTSMVAQLNGSTLHWGRLVPGYGAYDTPQLSELLDLDRRVQIGELGPGVLLDFANRQNMGTILIHLDRFEEAVRSALLQSLASPPGQSGWSILLQNNQVLVARRR